MRGASRCSVCRIREKGPDSVTTGEPSSIPANTLSIATWRWRDSPGLTPLDRFNFLFRAGRPIPSLELPERFVVLHPFARGASKSLTPEEIFEFTHLLVPIPVVVVGRSRVHIYDRSKRDSRW